MDSFWEFLKFAFLCGTIFWGLFLILLSLPGSRLRQISLRIYNITCYTITILLGLYIISPVDLIPDVIVGLGQIDDAAGLITAFFTGITGLIAKNQANRSYNPAINK